MFNNTRYNIKEWVSLQLEFRTVSKVPGSSLFLTVAISRLITVLETLHFSKVEWKKCKLLISDFNVYNGIQYIEILSYSCLGLFYSRWTILQCVSSFSIGCPALRDLIIFIYCCSWSAVVNKWSVCKKMAVIHIS